MNLTQREKEVALLLAKGFKQSEIAQRLTISRHTVYAHVNNIKGKTGARSPLEIAVNVSRATQR